MPESKEWNPDLLDDLTTAVNKHNAEKPSNTPDFILGQFLQDCLATLNAAIQEREKWYGRHDTPGGIGPHEVPEKSQSILKDAPEKGQPDDDRMLKWFEFSHLPANLRAVSRPFQQLAHDICRKVTPGPERTVALRKLVEAKDAAVRAVVYPGG